MKRDQPPHRTTSPPAAEQPTPPGEPTPDLAGQLGRSLKRYQSYVNAYTQRTAQEDGNDLNLSYRQIGVLFQLRSRGTQNVSALARAVNLTLPATSHLLERLVQRDLIERSEDPENRRQKRIALTEQGQVLLNRLDGEAVHAYTLLLRHAPAQVLEELRGCLLRLDQHLPATPGDFAAQAPDRPSDPSCADFACAAHPLSPEDHP